MKTGTKFISTLYCSSKVNTAERKLNGQSINFPQLELHVIPLPPLKTEGRIQQDYLKTTFFRLCMALGELVLPISAL